MKDFQSIINFIRNSRIRAIQAVNAELVLLNWALGKYISAKMQQAIWGSKTIEQLSAFIRQEEPGIKGFDKRSLERMRRFYETWKEVLETDATLPSSISGLLSSQIASTLSAQLFAEETLPEDFAATLSPQLEKEKDLLRLLCSISWSHHLDILSKTTHVEERLFYVGLTIRDKLTVRELRRQIESALFERQMLSEQKLKVPHPGADKIQHIFKDTYITEFLDLPEPYSEKDLQKALIAKMKKFILELGSDFLFVGEEYKLQVGIKDYYLDLLFYHRDLQCLVGFELKIEEFKPEHLGKINFYLEALDRDVKKPHENPSIGVLLCKTKDSEVVEYAMSRNMSPALIAEYQTKLPDKKLLQQKMHELLENNPTQNEQEDKTEI